MKLSLDEISNARCKGDFFALHFEPNALGDKFRPTIYRATLSTGKVLKVSWQRVYEGSLTPIDLVEVKMNQIQLITLVKRLKVRSKSIVCNSSTTKTHCRVVQACILRLAGEYRRDSLPIVYREIPVAILRDPAARKRIEKAISNADKD